MDLKTLKDNLDILKDRNIYNYTSPGSKYIVFTSFYKKTNYRFFNR